MEALQPAWLLKLGVQEKEEKRWKKMTVGLQLNWPCQENEFLTDLSRAAHFGERSLLSSELRLPLPLLTDSGSKTA